MNTIKFHKLDSRAILPSRKYDAVGWDIHACLWTESDRPNKAIVGLRQTRMIPTGIVAIPPPGYFITVCSRSGLAAKNVWVLNAPGIVDPDYRGEIKILLHNNGIESHYVQNEDRIAQLVIQEIVPCETEEVVLTAADFETERGARGFGSTGS